MIIELIFFWPIKTHQIQIECWWCHETTAKLPKPPSVAREMAHGRAQRGRRVRAQRGRCRPKGGREEEQRRGCRAQRGAGAERSEAVGCWGGGWEGRSLTEGRGWPTEGRWGIFLGAGGVGRSLVCFLPALTQPPASVFVQRADVKVCRWRLQVAAPFHPRRQVQPRAAGIAPGACVGSPHQPALLHSRGSASMSPPTTNPNAHLTGQQRRRRCHCVERHEGGLRSSPSRRLKRFSVFLDLGHCTRRL